MMDRQNIYPSKVNLLQKELRNLEESKISEGNKRIIKSFQMNLLSTGQAKELRVAKLSSQLRIMCTNITKDLIDFEKPDAENLIMIFNGQSNLSPVTQADYKKCLKQFFKWYKREDPRLDTNNIQVRKFYDFLDDVKTGYKITKADASQILTDDDCKIIVEKGCRTTRDKGLVDSLHESGCRIDEFLNVKLRDITIKDSHAEVRVDGKTGVRTIFLTRSLPNILKWLDVHPTKEDVNSFLWVNMSNYAKYEPMKHRATSKAVAQCIKRAGINKKCNLHWFRHSRATILAPKITTPMLCKFMGWTLNSNQVATYCHLSVKDLEDVFLSINGLKPKEEETNQPIKCICGTLNNADERYCFKCCKPLKVETVIQDQELVNSEIGKTMQWFMQMAKNPETMKKFEEFNKQD
jgi:integrase/recombinase XerD